MEKFLKDLGPVEEIDALIGFQLENGVDDYAIADVLLSVYSRTELDNLGFGSFVPNTQ